MDNLKARAGILLILFGDLQLQLWLPKGEPASVIEILTFSSLQISLALLSFYLFKNIDKIDKSKQPRIILNSICMQTVFRR